MGTKRSILTDGKGLPLAVVISGANTHDVKLLWLTLESVPIHRPRVRRGHLQNLCMDAGYTGHQKTAEKRGYTAQIYSRAEEKKKLQSNPNIRLHRWVVETVHSFLNRFRKLLVRYEKKAANYLALVQFACAIIVWRKLIPVHR